MQEFIITGKYNENVSKRNYETLHPKDIPPLTYIAHTQLLCDVLPQVLVFIVTNTTVPTISKIKKLRIIFMNFY